MKVCINEDAYRRGRFTLGMRGVLELESYLKEEFEELVHDCQRCKKLVLSVSYFPHGVLREADHCVRASHVARMNVRLRTHSSRRRGQAQHISLGSIHFHSYCYEAIRTARLQCPGCSTSFRDTPPQPIGEKAISRNEDEWRGDKRKRRRVSRRRVGNGDGEEEQEEEDVELEVAAVDEEEASQEQSQSDSQSQSQTVTQAGAGPVSLSFTFPVWGKEQDEG